MSAVDTMANEIRTGFWHVSDHEKETQEEASSCEHEEARSLTGRWNSGGNAWRVYAHIHMKGKKFNAEAIREVAAEYRRIRDHDPETFSYYSQLANAARALHRAGGQAALLTYKKRGDKRLKCGSNSAALLQLGDFAESQDGADTPASDALSVASEHARNAQVDRFMAMARQILTQERNAARSVAREEASTAKQVHGHMTAGGAPKLAESWRLVSAVDQADGSFLQVPSADSNPVLTYHESLQRIQNAMAEAMGAMTLKDAADAWDAWHRQILIGSCESLGEVPVTHRICFEAERCVCRRSGDEGALLRVLFARLQKAFKDVRQHFGKDWFHDKVDHRPLLVVRFTQRAVEPSMDGEPCPDTVEVSWFHVSRFSHAPTFSGCFLQMRRLPSEDKEGLIGVTPLGREGHPEESQWQTQWKVQFIWH